MKKLCLLILASAILSSNILTAKAKIEFECGKRYDWGVVKQKDSPLKAEIKLFNKGDDTLKIERVKPMCGCTTAPLSKKLIAPGDSAILKVTLNVEHYEGEVIKKISFTSNAEIPEDNLELKAVIYQPIKLFPNKYLNFSQMYLGTETITKVVINNLSGVDIKIKDIAKKPEDLVINMKSGDVIPKDSDFVFTATVNPTTIGPYTCNIEIFTDNIDVPEISLSGWGRADSADARKADFDALENETGDSTKSMPLNPVLINTKQTPVLMEPNQIINVESLPTMQPLPIDTVEGQVPVNKIQINKPENVKHIEIAPIPPGRMPIEKVKPVEESKPGEESELVKKKK